jgi:hypothetical protein
MITGQIDGSAARAACLGRAVVAAVAVHVCSPTSQSCRATSETRPVGHHLKQLLLAGLVTKRPDGMNVYYRLVPEAIAALAPTLDRGCC